MGRHDPNELLETIVARAAAVAGTPNGYLYLVDPEAGVLRLAVGLGIFAALDDLDDRPRRRRRRPRAGTRASRSSSRTTTRGPTGDPAWGLGRSARCVGVPLTAGSEVIGVIGLAAGDTGRVFDETDAAGLSRFAQLASVAMENARLHAAARTELAARARSEEELRTSTERLRRLADASFEALVIHRDGRILEVNAAFAALFGHAPEEVIGAPSGRASSRSRCAGRARAPARDRQRDAVRDDGPDSRTAPRPRWSSIGRTIPYADEVPARATAIRDIRERRAIQERLARQSFYDTLTGLPNRSLFLDRVTHALG